MANIDLKDFGENFEFRFTGLKKLADGTTKTAPKRIEIDISEEEAAALKEMGVLVYEFTRGDKSIRRVPAIMTRKTKTKLLNVFTGDEETVPFEELTKLEDMRKRFIFSGSYEVILHKYEHKGEKKVQLHVSKLDFRIEPITPHLTEDSIDKRV